MSTKHTVIGADYCPFCVRVKQYLDEHKIPYEYIDSQTEEGKQRRKVESQKYGWKTIPLVFINDKFVGGCDDFFKGIADGTIQIEIPKL